jgi:hypothetical protein
MKPFHVVVSAFILLIAVTAISCQKNAAKKFKGEYAFTTIAWTYCGWEAQYDTVDFFGNITEDTKTSLRIEYAIPVDDTSSNTGIHIDGIIIANVDSEGNLSNPDYATGDYHKYFQGSIDDAGNVNLQFGYHGLGWGSEQKISGKKL